MTPPLKPTQIELFDSSSLKKKALQETETFSARLPDYKFPTRLCLIVSCIMILSAVSFALGVERGKSLLRKSMLSQYLVSTTTSKPIVKETAPIPATQLTRPTAVTMPLKPAMPTLTIPVQVSNKKLEKQEKNDTLYYIQLATFRKDSSDYIQKELGQLKQKGYTPRTITSGEYIVVCAGNFVTRKDAEEHLKKFKQQYKDCYIRKI